MVLFLVFDESVGLLLRDVPSMDDCGGDKGGFLMGPHSQQNN